MVVILLLLLGNIAAAAEPESAWRTTYTRETLDDFPTGREFWSVLETIDPLAVTERLDHAGLTPGLAPRLSANGASWTQTQYRLNGLDITDPALPGRPLGYPDFDVLSGLGMGWAAHPADAAAPGALIDFGLLEPGERWSAGGEAFYQGAFTQEKNVDSRLSAAGLPSHGILLRRDLDAGARARGPLGLGWKGIFSIDARRQSQQVPVRTEPQEFGVGAFLAGLERPVGAASELSLLWLGQFAERRRYGPDHFPTAATLDQDESFHVAQVQDRIRLDGDQDLRLGLSFARGMLDSGFPSEAGPQAARELAADSYTGAAPLALSSERRRWNAKGAWEKGAEGESRHRLRATLEWDRGEVDSTAEAREDVELTTLNGQGALVAQLNTPTRYRSAVDAFRASFEERFLPTPRWMLWGGVLVDSSLGTMPRQSVGARSFFPASEIPSTRQVVSWNDWAPRLGVWHALDEERRTTLSASFSRYLHALNHEIVDAANPNAPSRKTFAWNDANGDGRYQPGEEGALLGAAGPAFSGVDADLRRPKTDELLLRGSHAFSPRFAVTLSVLGRWEKDAVDRVNVGVPDSAFAPVDIVDPGDNGVVDSFDSRTITVWNQDPATLGQDRFLVTNPAGRNSLYRGAHLLLEGAAGRSFDWRAGFGAYESAGAPGPGNTPSENDSGVLTGRFDSPNGGLFSSGRLFFDRAFLAHWRFRYKTAGGFLASIVGRYWDGSPFSRRVVVTGLNQGPILAQATPRGDPPLVGPRAEYNLTMDLRLQKRLDLEGRSLFAVLDVFNLLNLANSVTEYSVSGPLFLGRVPQSSQAPRVYRLGLRYLF